MPSPLKNDPVISIHALREEGDIAAGINPILAATFLSTPSARRATCLPSPLKNDPVISIHALREEGDARQKMTKSLAIKFLSTPSARRATRSFFRSTHFLYYFYPRPPRGGRLDAGNTVDRHFPISIHALREEGDDLYSVPGLYKL